MKAIQTQGIIGSLTFKVDKSAKFGINTPELNDEEANAIRALQNQNVNILIQPEEQYETLIAVENKMEGKTPSERLRNVFFILWKQDGAHGIFNTYYMTQMEKLIEHFKSKIVELY